MRLTILWRAAASLLLALVVTTHASASSGGSGSPCEMSSLQKQVDDLLGRGRVNVTRDWIGSRLGDPDPFTLSNSGRDLSITLVNVDTPDLALGWYLENGSAPTLDGVDDAVLLNGLPRRGTELLFRVPLSVSRFGFYIASLEDDDGDDEEAPVYYYSNRLWNESLELGDCPSIPVNARMLVFDVSRWKGPDTYLFAVERPKNHSDDSEDSDDSFAYNAREADYKYSNLLFLVSGVYVTGQRRVSFGQLKAIYR
jgi:hypothetical protein